MLEQSVLDLGFQIIIENMAIGKLMLLVKIDLNWTKYTSEVQFFGFCLFPPAKGDLVANNGIIG